MILRMCVGGVCARAHTTHTIHTKRRAVAVRRKNSLLDSSAMTESFLESDGKGRDENSSILSELMSLSLSLQVCRSFFNVNGKEASIRSVVIIAVIVLQLSHRMT